MHYEMNMESVTRAASSSVVLLHIEFYDECRGGSQGWPTKWFESTPLFGGDAKPDAVLPAFSPSLISNTL